MRADGRLFWMRAVWLLDRLRGGRPTTAADLAEHFELSRPTARRILRSLRDDFATPLAWDRAAGTWTLSDPHWELPRLPLTPGEVTALAFARGLVSHVTAPRIAEDMAGFWNKLSMELADQAPAGAAFAEAVTALAPRWTAPDPAVMELVLRGVALARRLEIRYLSPWSGVLSDRVVEPRHLILYEGSFYLAAHCLLRGGELRLFHLCGVKRAELTERRVDARSFVLDDVVDSYGLMLGGEPVDVCVRIAPPAAHRAVYETWHRDQRDDVAEDGTLTRTFPARGLEEVVRLVLSFGAAARALGPPALVQRVRAEVLAMAGMIGGEH